ncbi:Cathepsin O [Triplophysa tibetana]|uniref:Cathepsin O n=1 Tax=Triplophysa tibetana TaxID=1572043 RepID=A0A5A9NHJ7_9TELE|nr:Cathepsin O [Triplophysa tibetana]
MAFTKTFVCSILYYQLLKGSSSVKTTEQHQTEGFNAFQQPYDRNYDNNELYESFINFKNSLERHKVANSALKKFNQSARYGINQFSDLSPKQFKGERVQSHRCTPTDISLREQLTSLLISERYLTVQADAVPKFDPPRPNIRVKTSYPCGGCWAFSVVEAIETVFAKHAGKLQELSVQQVIDCSYRNHGCNGGSPVETLDWLMKTKLKLVSQVEYPFKAVAGICQYFSQSHDGVVLTNYSAHDFRIMKLILCSSGQEEIMISMLLETGPLVVIVDAISWQDYLGGIIQHHCSSHNANHAVVITGYDTTGTHTQTRTVTHSLLVLQSIKVQNAALHAYHTVKDAELNRNWQTPAFCQHHFEWGEKLLFNVKPQASINI